MDNKFKFTLSGSKLFLIYGIPHLVLIAMYLYGVVSMVSIGGDVRAIGHFYLSYGIFMIGLFLLHFVVIKVTLNNISHREGKVHFTGSFGQYVWINLRDGLLSLASFGIYRFWFTENLTRFYVDNTSFADRTLSFKAKGGELFKRFLIFFLPFIILVMVAYVMIVISVFGFNKGSYGIGHLIGSGLFLFVSYILYMIGYMVYIYKAIEWAINIESEEYSISLETEFWPTFRFILKQLGLCLITSGLYAPAAITSAYKYLIKHLLVTNGNRVVSINNEVDTTSSWGYLFAQYLLTSITIGIYTPWAIVRVLRWFIESTEFEGFEEIEEESIAIMIEENASEKPNESVESNNTEEIL